jgi:hypothetical protein
MASRKAISKKTRFEVFKRDKFTCQYCGRSAPEVVLNCDHIDPIANGGSNDVINLVTSCESCNAGKKDRLLTDDSVIKLQVDQLAQLEQRRQQLEMMMQWKNELIDIQEKTGEMLSTFWERLSDNTRKLTDLGKKEVCKLAKKYSVEEVVEAMSDAVASYVKDGTAEQFSKAFKSIAGCCRVNREEKDRPGSKDLYYIRGIVRSKLSGNYFNSEDCLKLLKTASDRGVSMDDLRSIAKSQYRTYSQFTNGVWLAVYYAEGGA